MGPAPIRTLEPDDLSGATDPMPRGRLGALLLGSGQITPAALSLALAHQAESSAPLGEILCRDGAISETVLFDALAQQYGTIRVDPADYVPDIQLIDRLGAQFCLVNGVYPVARAGAITVIACCDPARFSLVRPLVEAELGPVSIVLSSRTDLHRGVACARKRSLALSADTRTAPEASCRTLSKNVLIWGGVGCVVGLGGLATLAPVATFTTLTVLALAIVLINTVFAATIAVLWFRNRNTPGEPLDPLRPVPVSILVPLFREKNIAARLVHRLSQIDYPNDQLEVLLVVEEEDIRTRTTLAACTLSPAMRTVIVPRGTLQTKPRAMNYALDFCSGQIVGVYDAEDAPDPGQIRAVVGQFQRSAPVVACLQGRLDYYNSRKNWLSRCFTIEYATWFRIMLPGLARLGLVLPLGGTTLFFRKSALVNLGGWDAHNVTEDADLGLRLARHGYRTDLLDSVTLEEANCRAWPWIRQRSRWIKGYGMTYFVHMRNPRALWRDLGPRRFWGVQLLFLGNLLGALTAPILWAFVLLMVGLPHPWSAAMAGTLGTVLTVAMAMAMLTHWGVWIMGAYAKGDRGLAAWAPTLTVYHTMATAAALKASFEIITRPFFWDKTQHGEYSDATAAVSAPRASPQPPSI